MPRNLHRSYRDKWNGWAAFFKRKPRRPILKRNFLSKECFIDLCVKENIKSREGWVLFRRNSQRKDLPYDAEAHYDWAWKKRRERNDKLL